MTDFPVTSPKGQEAIALLPDYYLHSRLMRALCQANGITMDQFKAAIDSILEQAFVDTCTWGLSKWEHELGLALKPGQTDAERRSRIKSRTKGYGTATLKLIKQIANAYDNGEVDIVEDFPGYKIYVYFISAQGIPTNYADLQQALREVIPAHISIEYVFNYLNWDDLDALDLTWDQIDALDMSWDEIALLA